MQKHFGPSLFAPIAVGAEKSSDYKKPLPISNNRKIQSSTYPAV